jgi:hypothetical protein
MEQELYLYRLFAETVEGKRYAIIVLSSSDEKALDHAEKELERHTIETPTTKEWALVEKKRVRSGTGYVLESSDLHP